MYDQNDLTVSYKKPCYSLLWNFYMTVHFKKQVAKDKL